MNAGETAELLRDTKIVGKTFNEVTRAMNSTTQVTKSVRRLSGCSQGGDLGSKLIAAGMACIVFPEPVISDILGSTLVVAGMFIKGRRGSTIMDIFKEAGRITSELRKVNLEI